VSKLPAPNESELANQFGESWCHHIATHMANVQALVMQDAAKFARRVRRLWMSPPAQNQVITLCVIIMCGYQIIQMH